MSKYRIVKETNRLTKAERFIPQEIIWIFWSSFSTWYDQIIVFWTLDDAEEFLDNKVRSKKEDLKEKKIRKAGWSKEIINYPIIK